MLYYSEHEKNYNHTSDSEFGFCWIRVTEESCKQNKQIIIAPLISAYQKRSQII